MTAEEKEKGIKSALELAMERLDKEGGTPQPLTDGQKEAIAEIERDLKARIAEVEILTRQRMAEARGQGDDERLRELEEGRTREVGRLQRQAETKKERVKKGGA